MLKAVAQPNGSFCFDLTHYLRGCEYYHKTGKIMADDGMERLAESDAIFLGAVGAPGVPDHICLWDLLLKIRSAYLPGLRCPIFSAAVTAALKI